MEIETFITTFGLKQSRLAKLLGISPSTFTNKMKKLGGYGFTGEQRQTLIDYLTNMQQIDLHP